MRYTLYWRKHIGTNTISSSPFAGTGTTVEKDGSVSEIIALRLVNQWNRSGTRFMYWLD